LKLILDGLSIKLIEFNPLALYPKQKRMGMTGYLFDRSSPLMFSTSQELLVYVNQIVLLLHFLPNLDNPSVVFIHRYADAMCVMGIPCK